MKLGITLATLVGCAALAACSSNEDNAANADMNAGYTDMNAGITSDLNTVDANTTINGADGMNATENAMVNDLTTNDADTNLANGT